MLKNAKVSRYNGHFIGVHALFRRALFRQALFRHLDVFMRVRERGGKGI